MKSSKSPPNSSLKSDFTPSKTKKIVSKKINGKIFVSSQEASLPCNHNEKDFFMIKYGRFMFHCFRSRKDQLGWLASTRAKKYEYEIYEVMYGDKPCAFYADIEVYCPSNSTYIDELSQRIITDFTKACEMRDEHDLRWIERHRITKEGFIKVSFHVRGGTRIFRGCLLYTSPSPRDQRGSRMPSSA